MPLLNNSDGTIWHVPEMSAMLHNPGARRHLVRQIVDHIAQNQQVGLALDFELVPKKSQHDFVAFITRFGGGSSRCRI